MSSVPKHSVLPELASCPWVAVVLLWVHIENRRVFESVRWGSCARLVLIQKAAEPFIQSHPVYYHDRLRAVKYLRSSNLLKIHSPRYISRQKNRSLAKSRLT